MNLFLNIRFRILYADIVNFTPLSEKFTPPELVQILNKLFGKFDQLAQVYYGGQLVSPLSFFVFLS
jgi:class 3 adenylate cyclase